MDRRAGSVRRPGARSLLALALAAVLSPILAAAGGPGLALEPEQIRVVQRALHVRGYAAEPTGAWDASTSAALASFQSASGLPATGSIDAVTARALDLDRSAVTPAAGRLAPGAADDPAVNCAINNTIDCRPGP
jgi:peptidoglycan hydrolase-like protein with peptidoglycan-binding domain